MNHPLSQRFLRFANTECLHSSELYYHLATSIAEDDELLKIAESSGKGQPTPNLFLGAVQYILASNLHHPLATHYPNFAVTPTQSNIKNTFPIFKKFILSNREKIEQLLSTQLVQTNEVSRSSYLFPAIMYATRFFSNRPLALIEIGTSAGLNLLWDKYAYNYGAKDLLGDLKSPVLIHAEYRGDIPDYMSHSIPKISHRIGLDLNIIDTRKPNEAQWLSSLVWPEHQERRNNLKSAMKHRSAFDLDLREGDGFSMVKEIIGELPEEVVPCVYHTHVANQISIEAQKTFLSSLTEIGEKRDLIHIFNNINPNLYLPNHNPDVSAFILHLTQYKDNFKNETQLAKTDGHGKWFEWLPTQIEMK